MHQNIYENKHILALSIYNNFIELSWNSKSFHWNILYLYTQYSLWYPNILRYLWNFATHDCLLNSLLRCQFENLPNLKSDLLTLRDLDANGNGLDYILFQALSIQIPLWHNKKAIRKTSKCILVNFIQSKSKWKSLCWLTLVLFSFEIHIKFTVRICSSRLFIEY